MPENQYRASRVCRILGNPTAYQIVVLLLNSKYKPSEIAEKLGLSLSLISHTLRILRNIDLLRYETKGKVKVYWIKDKTISQVCRMLEEFVVRIRGKN